MFKAVRVFMVLLAVLAGCNGTAATFEDSVAAAAIGADDLTVLDSVTRYPQDGGRTVRFTIAGDPIAVAPLGFKDPDTCTPEADCTAHLKNDLAYAKGQSA